MLFFLFIDVVYLENILFARVVALKTWDAWKSNVIETGLKDAQ